MGAPKNNTCSYIYRHLKPNGEVFYIGIGSCDGYGRSRKKSNRNNWWKRTVSKYGYEIQILKCNISWEEACELEILLIDWYGRKDLGKGNLVNLTDGGEGVVGRVITEEFRELKRQIRGENHPLYGRKRPPETIAKMSASLKGRKSWNKGGTISEEAKLHLSIINTGELHPMYGKLKSDETKRKIALKNAIAIIQYSKEGEFIREWESQSEAKRVLGVNNISACIKGRRNFAGGFIWKFKENN